MSLRLKSLLIFSVTVVLLFGIVLALVKALIEREFSSIEIAHISKHAKHLFVEIQEELDPIIATVADWAAWDELYRYASGQDPTFPERNLDDRVLTNLRLDFISIWKEDGSLALLKTRTTDRGNNISPELLEETILGKKIINQGDSGSPSSGLILVGNDIFVIASLPIVQSDRSGPTAGTLVSGRLLSDRDISSIEEFSDYQFRFLPRPREQSPIPISRLDGDFAPIVRIIDSEHIAASVPVVDIDGEFIATAELASTRILHIQAGKTIRIFIIVLASSAGILLFVVWYLLDANVIHPVRWLADKLAVAAARGELPSNLGRKGGVEIINLTERIEDLARTVAFTEANYRAIVEAQTDFIFCYLPDGKITFVNQALCRYFNRTRESLLNSDARDLVAQEDRARVVDTISRLSAENPVITFDHRVQIPGGGITWFRRTERAIFSESGQLRELQSVARDVTQAHNSRERLEASETRYRRLFETATDGILIVKQSDHTIADANPTLCRLLGLPHSATIGRTVESLPPFNNRKTIRILRKLLDGEQPSREAEIELPSVNDERRFSEVAAGVYYEGGERVVQLNFRDVSLRKRTNDELRQLSGHLMRLQDAERRRIARELHDSTAQNLSALQMAITHLEGAVPTSDAKARAALDEIRSLTDLSLGEIRTISYLLHPPLLDEVGLLFALRWYVDGFMTRTEKIVRLEIPDSLERLPAEIETTIFRIVQEGLTNVHRHSGARKAWIRLAVEDGSLTLVIRDDGRGMPLGPSSPGAQGSPILGVGIAGMRERLRQFNGSLVIESNRNGTIVTATLPLQPNDPTDD